MTYSAHFFSVVSFFVPDSQMDIWPLSQALGAEYEVDPLALDDYLSHIHESKLVRTLSVRVIL